MPDSCSVRRFLTPSASKSFHMRLVHSRCDLQRAGGQSFDGRRDLGCVIEMGELVLPWTVDGEMLFDIGDQISEPFAAVVAGAVVVHIAEGSLDGVGSRAVGRQE